MSAHTSNASPMQWYRVAMQLGTMLLQIVELLAVLRGHQSLLPAVIRCVEHSSMLCLERVLAILTVLQT